MVLFSCSLYFHFIVLVACVLLLALLFDHDECYIEPACVLFALQCPSFLNSYHEAKPCSCHFMQNQQNNPTSTEMHESNRVINCHDYKNPFYFELEV